MKRIHLLSVSIACLALLFTTCKKNEDDKVDNNDAGGLTISNTQETSQTAFADEETTGGFTFTAKSDWTANIKETKGNSVSWLKLLYNGEEKYSGSAGTFKLEISIDENYTGQTRSASIEIVSGSDKITVTVTQNGTTESGEIPKGFEIDLSGKIPAGAGIVTLQVSMYYYKCGIFYNFDLTQTGGKLILPATIKPNHCFSATDDVILYGDDILALNNSGEIGRFSLDGPKDYWAQLVYVDKDYNVNDNDEGHIWACSFKKGWNYLYVHQYDNTTERRRNTTEKPAGINFNWTYHSYSEEEK